MTGTANLPSIRVRSRELNQNPPMGFALVEDKAFGERDCVRTQLIRFKALSTELKDLYGNKSFIAQES